MIPSSQAAANGTNVNLTPGIALSVTFAAGLLLSNQAPSWLPCNQPTTVCMFVFRISSPLCPKYADKWFDHYILRYYIMFALALAGDFVLWTTVARLSCRILPGAWTVFTCAHTQTVKRHRCQACQTAPTFRP